jgi:glycine cleavage system H protein
MYLIEMLIFSNLCCDLPQKWKETCIRMQREPVVLALRKPGEREEDDVVALLVVLTFLTLILIDGIVQYVQAHREQTVAAGARGDRRIAAEAMVPDGLYLGRHAWVELGAQGARVGLDGLVSGLIGRVDALELPAVGGSVRRGERLFSLRQGERTVTVTAPMDGTVKAVNVALAQAAEDILREPYESWVCRLEPTSLERDAKLLRIGNEAREWLRSELQQVREFLLQGSPRDPALGWVMPDGGDLRPGVLDSLDDRTWGEFESRFLAGESGGIR